MLSDIFLALAWVAMGACALCLVCSLYVVIFYPKYAQWYIDRNRTAPTRLRGYWKCVGWGLGMLVVAVLFAVAAYKTLPETGASGESAQSTVTTQ